LIICAAISDRIDDLEADATRERLRARRAANKSTIAVFGYSDDIIAISGDINDELSPDDTPAKLAFSDGTVLSVIYDADGCWRVNRVAAGSATMEKVEAEGPDTDNYSDRVTLTGEIRWMVAGNYYVATGEEATAEAQSARQCGRGGNSG
jgi:hypothetical protein